MINLYFKKLNPEAKLPVQTHSTDAGVDLFSMEDIFIDKESHYYSRVIPVKTGVAWNPFLHFPLEDIATDLARREYNIYMQLADKSSVALNYGLKIMGGVIDQEYRGEIIVLMQTTPYKGIDIKKGQKICQGIVKVIPKIKVIEEVDTLDSTVRGEGGFGSTGNF